MVQKWQINNHDEEHNSNWNSMTEKRAAFDNAGPESVLQSYSHSKHDKDNLKR